MYEYEEEKPSLMTIDGQKAFLKNRDWVLKTLNKYGAFNEECALVEMPEVINSFFGIACLDRMIELGEIKRIKRPANYPNNYNIFVKKGE